MVKNNPNQKDKALSPTSFSVAVTVFTYYCCLIVVFVEPYCKDGAKVLRLDKMLKIPMQKYFVWRQKYSNGYFPV